MAEVGGFPFNSYTPQGRGHWGHLKLLPATGDSLAVEMGIHHLEE